MDATVAGVVVGDVANVLKGFLVNDAVTYGAERDNANGGTPVTGHRQAYGDVVRAGIGVLLSDIV